MAITVAGQLACAYFLTLGIGAYELSITFWTTAIAFVLLVVLGALPSRPRAAAAH
jgi:hypothetical protein